MSADRVDGKTHFPGSEDDSDPKCCRCWPRLYTLFFELTLRTQAVAKALARLGILVLLPLALLCFSALCSNMPQVFVATLKHLCARFDTALLYYFDLAAGCRSRGLLLAACLRRATLGPAEASAGARAAYRRRLGA